VRTTVFNHRSTSRTHTGTENRDKTFLKTEEMLDVRDHNCEAISYNFMSAVLNLENTETNI
jgi:hypothetical protein